MTSPAVEETLRELSRLDAASRRPRTMVWFPLLAYGLVNLGALPTVLVIGRDHLAPYFLPLNLVAGALCAVHYKRAGKAAGLQAPLFAWLAVIMAVSMVAPLCSFEGRAHGLDQLNLAGPTIAMTLGYAILALWARSTVLLVAVTSMVVVILVAVSSSSGDAAIAWQVGFFAAIMLSLSLLNWSRRSTVA